MTKKERLAENVEKIFWIFKEQEITPDIAEKIEKAIKDMGSIISFEDIEEALNYMLVNNYFNIIVHFENLFPEKSKWETKFFFRKSKPRIKKEK